MILPNNIQIFFQVEISYTAIDGLLLVHGFDSWISG